MLRAIPKSIFSWNFRIQRDETIVAEIDMAWVRERADVQIGQETYTVHRTSVLAGTFALEFGHQVLARAEKVSAWRRAFVVELPDRQLTLKPQWIGGRGFVVMEGATPLGWITPTSWLTRSAVIELPDDIELPEQVFLFWLVMLMWRRAASAGGGGH